MKKLIALILALTLLCVLFSACSETIEETEAPTATESTATEPTQPSDGFLRVGDSFTDDAQATRFTFLASGDYTGYADYLAPNEGNKVIFVDFLIENISENTVLHGALPGFNMTCYADDQEMALYYYGDFFYGGELIPGRAAKAHFFYEVPKAAKEIQLEYIEDYFNPSADPVKLLVEGVQDSGIVPKCLEAAEAKHLGEMADVDGVELTLISVEETTDESTIIPEGCHMVAVTFSANNIGSDAMSIGGSNFAAYADGFLLDSENYTGIALHPNKPDTLTLNYVIPKAAAVEVAYFDIYDCYATFRIQ